MNLKKVKKTSKYKKTLKKSTQIAVDELERMFRKKWQEDDETLNEGEKDYIGEEGEDEIYNN